MKKFFIASFAALFFASLGFAQEHGHSDIEFGYDDLSNIQSIVVESIEFTSEGIQITEGEFENDFGDVFAENPGFITAADEGLRVNADDRITVQFLDASQETTAGVGFVNYYDPVTKQLEPGVGQIQIVNQAGASVNLNGTTLTGGPSLLLSLGSDGTLLSNPGEEGEVPETLPAGEIHNHLVFDLQGTEDAGAYGILFQFEADFADANGNTDGVVDVTSAPIWLIFNNDMDDVEFEDEAVDAFSPDFLLGDVDLSSMVDFADIPAFIAVLMAGDYQAEADIDQDSDVDFADIPGFITILMGS